MLQDSNIGFQSFVEPNQFKSNLSYSNLKSKKADSPGSSSSCFETSSLAPSSDSGVGLLFETDSEWESPQSNSYISRWRKFDEKLYHEDFKKFLKKHTGYQAQKNSRNFSRFNGSPKALFDGCTDESIGVSHDSSLMKFIESANG
jgi:hypothetical protein